MRDENRERMRAWVETWKRAGSALQRVKTEELRSEDYGKDFELIDGMLEWVVDHARERKTSGLVEQQRLFRKMRNRDDR